MRDIAESTIQGIEILRDLADRAEQNGYLTVEDVSRIFQRGAHGGGVDSMAAVLGSIGIRVFGDDAETAERCLEAARDGDTAAMRRLSAMYNQGTGVGQDDGKALSW